MDPISSYRSNLYMKMLLILPRGLVTTQEDWGSAHDFGGVQLLLAVKLECSCTLPHSIT